MSHCIVSNTVDKLADTTVMNMDGNTLYIYDYIASSKWGPDDTEVTAIEFVNQLAAMSGDITVRINSKGGEVGSALAIYQQLIEHNGVVNCIVDGYAYSCAAWIMLAGSIRTINTGGLVMIHNPAMYALIDSEESINKIAPQWRAHRDAINLIISSRTGLKPAKVTEMMNAETYMTSKQAVDNGFCTGIREAKATIPATVNTLPEVTKSSVAIHPLMIQSLVAKSGKYHNSY